MKGAKQPARSRQNHATFGPARRKTITDTPTDDRKLPRNAAARAVVLTIDRAIEFIGSGDSTSVIVRRGEHVECLALSSIAFEHWLRTEFMRTHATVLSKQAITTATATLSAHAKEVGTDDEPRVRIAGDSSRILIDLGDDRHQAVAVTRDGWEIIAHPKNGPYFTRPEKLAPLPVPTNGGDIERIWRFVNVEDKEDRMLTLAFLIACLTPRGPYPGLALSGEQDTGKTTTMRMIKALVDPTKASGETHAATDLRPPPRELRDLTAAVKNDRLLGFDNLSSIDAELSDQLCRLVSGTELVARGLFTNYDEVGFAAARPVMLNGIPDVASRDDLADRVIKISVSRPLERVGEEKLWSDFRNEWPQLLGALLDILSAALKGIESVEEVTDSRVRMADFARLGEAVAREQGWSPGAFIEAYASNRARAASEIVELDPLTEPLQALLAASPEGVWRGRLAQLLKELEIKVPFGRPRDWPASARALSERLKRLTPALRRVGIEVEKVGTGPVYEISLREATAPLAKAA